MLDNVFNIMDFPGFNDKHLDKAVYSFLSNQCAKFDYIFYIFDCNECLKKKTSEAQFDKVLSNIKSSLLSTNENAQQTQLVILFNKFDLISIDADVKRFVSRQRKLMIKKIKEEHHIPIEKVKFYNVSANNLLCKRIVQVQDSVFVAKHPELMSSVYKFSQKFMSHDRIEKLSKKKSIAKQLQKLNENMIKSENEKKKVVMIVMTVILIMVMVMIIMMISNKILVSKWKKIKLIKY